MRRSIGRGKRNDLDIRIELSIKLLGVWDLLDRLDEEKKAGK